MNLRTLPVFSIVLTCVLGRTDGASRFDTWADAFAAEWMRADPESATSTQYFNGAEQDALDRQLSPATVEARSETIALARRGLKELRTFELSQLDETARISASTLQWQLEAIVASEPFADHEFVFHQFRGLHASLVEFLTQRHPIRNGRDVENYLARLELVAPRMEEGIARASDQAARGFLPPRFIITATLGQFDRFLDGEAANNVLVTSLAERAGRVESLTEAERTAYVATAETTVAKNIIPAYRRARDMLAEHREKATDDAGLWRLPRGDAAYAHALRRFTTTALSADQIHSIGVAEVTRIESEMDGLLRSLGYGEGSVAARYQRLEADLQPPEADPRPRLLDEYTAMVRDAEQRASSLFDLRPTAPVEVRREPAMTERNAAAHYSFPAADGSRPGIFWVPLPGSPYRMASRRTLAYHEAVPGHHFQIALQQEMTELPRFRRDRVFGGISAHSEGWALYAEKLAVENGWYAGDTVGHLGQLHSELFRARRLVVDTGLHAKRWTRQQAIDFGISPAEVERYVVMPGQACSYKIGMIRILELRARARTELGEKFSLKAFHNAVLRAGTVSLDTLDQVVAGYVAKAR